MIEIDFRCLHCHGAIEKDGKGLDLFFAKEPGQKHNQKLSSTNRKSRDQNLAFLSRCVANNLGKFLNGFLEGTMVAIAVGRLKEHRVRMINRAEIPREEDVGLSQIAGEHDRFSTAVL